MLKRQTARECPSHRLPTRMAQLFYWNNLEHSWWPKKLAKWYWWYALTGIPFCDPAWNDGRRHNRSSLRSIATFITFVILQHGSIILLKECTDWPIQNCSIKYEHVSLNEWARLHSKNSRKKIGLPSKHAASFPIPKLPWHWGFFWSVTPSFKLTPRRSRVASALVVKSFKSRQFTQLVSYRKNNYIISL